MADAKTQSAITIEEDRKGGFFMVGLVLLITNRVLEGPGCGNAKEY